MKFRLLLIFVVLVFTSKAQDTIKLKDGRIFHCLITNVDSSSINFTIKRNENIVKTNISRSEVASFSKYQSQNTIIELAQNDIKPNTNCIYPICDSIILSKNSRVIFKNGRMLNYEEFIDTLKSNQSAYKLTVKAKRNFNTSQYFSLLGSFYIGYGIGYTIGTAIINKPIDWTYFGVFEILGIAVLQIGKPFKNRAIFLTKKAISEYNVIKKQTSNNYNLKPELKMYFQGNKIGIALTF